MVEISLSEEEQRILDALEELGAGTVSDVALKTLKPPKQVESSLDRLQRDGVLRVRTRRGFENKIYTVSQRNGKGL